MGAHTEPPTTTVEPKSTEEATETETTKEVVQKQTEVPDKQATEEEEKAKIKESIENAAKLEGDKRSSLVQTAIAVKQKMIFKQDFDEIIGSRDDLFISDCSVEVYPAKC